MNKLLIVLLAVCLVSTHAFVKRDAPADAKDGGLDAIINQLKVAAEQASKQIGQAFDPDNMKKNFNELVDKVNDLTSSIKPADKKQ